MIFKETKFKGLLVIEIEKNVDNRGFFARSWCAKEFEAHGIKKQIVQCNISYNALAGTLRGMHYQAAPHAEAKLVRCTAGAVYDVIIDLRPDSPTYKEWTSVELNAENRKIVYVPEGFAQGFITLKDNTEVFYQMTEYYTPEAARAVRYNDPAFNISWPIPVKVISDRDRDLPDFKES